MFTHDTTRRALGSLALAVSLTLSACGGCDGGENNANDTNNTNNTNNAQCTVGEAGCTCTSEGACTDGSVCTDGQCVGASASGLVVDASEARSCEILLEEGSGELLDVTWGEGLEGAWRRHAPRVALAFSMSSDADFPSSIAELVTTDGASITIRSVDCFDASGAKLAAPNASIN